MSIFKIDARDSVTIMRLSDKELANYERMEVLREQLAATLRQTRTKNVLVDLQDAAFLNSTMIGQLIQIVQRCKSSNVAIKICRANAAIQEVLRIICFERLADVCETEQTALRAFRREKQSNTDYMSEAAQQEVSDLRSKADAGDVDAQYRLGWCLENGYGVEQNSHDAFRMYGLAAMQSSPSALLALATFYAYGITVPQNYDEATRLYQQAAELGLPDAQYAVGMNFDFGIGVPENREIAAEWYKKAAAQGHDRAQEALQNVLH